MELWQIRALKEGFGMWWFCKLLIIIGFCFSDVANLAGWSEEAPAE